MLKLGLEQLDVLEEVELRRHAAGIGAVLAETWPAMTERLQERWPAFVEAALLEGRRHGIVDPVDLARYASLWCIWGPAFDAKPAFGWAAEIVADASRSPALKVHQLAHRTRDELGRRQPAAAGAAPVVTVAQFDAALGRLKDRVGALAAARSVFVSDAPRAPAIKPCDVSTVDLMLAEAEGLQEYRHGAAGWQRAAVPRLADPPAHWTRAPDEPVELAVPSYPLRGGAAARLNLRVETLAACDPRVHPEVVHTGPQGRLAWKGRDAARLSLALYAPAPAPLPPRTSPPGIGAETPPDLQTVRVASCGLRDAGAPFGDVAVGVAVRPATQWLFEVQHPAWGAMAWPAGDAPAAPAPAVTCRLEADGAPRDAAFWQREWRRLHAAFHEGFERLYNAWTRALDGQAARLDVEATPLVGQAGFTWGYRRTAPNAVEMRVEGVLDLLACSVDVRLAGELVDGAARSRIRLHARGRTELRRTVAQVGAVAAEGRDLKSATCAWHHPFTVEIDALANGEPVTLGVAPNPVPFGALVGSCGLRPRPDAAGWQWFYTLRLEPIVVVTQSSDPLLGTSRRSRALVPALTLVDWSAG